MTDTGALLAHSRPRKAQTQQKGKERKNEMHPKCVLTTSRLCMSAVETSNNNANNGQRMQGAKRIVYSNWCLTGGL